MAGLPGNPAGKVGIGVYMHKQYMHHAARAGRLKLKACALEGLRTQPRTTSICMLHLDY